MGRAVHTNFNAAFSCEALKVAVIKNRWLANRLGGEMFSVMFKYEGPRKITTSSWEDLSTKCQKKIPGPATS